MVKAAVMADAMSHVRDATCASSDDEVTPVVPRMTLVKNWNMEGMAIAEARPPTLMMVDSGRVSGLWNLNEWMKG